MKHIFFIATLFISCSAFAQEKSTASSNQPPIVPVNGIAIVVNDDVITKHEIQERTQMIEQRLKAQGVALPPQAELHRQIVERMIVEKAQLQLARDLGLKVDDIMLDRAIARIAEQNKLSVQGFRDQLEKEGLSYALFRENLRDDILMQRVLEREVDSKIQVSESEVDNYLSAQKENKQKNEEIDIAQILIRIPENTTPEALAKIQTRAEDVLQKVKAGDDFSQLAVTYSDSPEGLKGGSLGWREESRYPQLFLDAISKLNVGETSGLIKSANGFHILKLTGKRNGGQSADGVQQAHVRLIVINTSPTVTIDQARQKIKELKQRTETGGKFDELAKKFSNDGSASKGGDLGWIHPGDVPALDPIIATLKEGQVSEPIETPDGVFIIQVLGRKTDDVSPERQRLLARQTIRARKVDEATLDWMRQLRDQAYVEIRDQ